MSALLALSALGPSAFAGGREDLESALLARSLGEHERSAVELRTVVRSEAADDPARAWASYWLATARLEAGDTGGARDAARECVRVGPARAECLALLGRLEVDAHAIRALPTIWTFDGDHGVVHLWTQGHRGGLRVDARDGDPALVWASEHDDLDPGTLVFGVDRAIPPGRGASLRGRLSSPGRDAWLAVVFVDVRGEWFGLPTPVALPAGRDVALDRALATATGPTGPLDPASVELVLIRDMTAKYDPTGGSSLIVLDDVGLVP